MNENEIAYSRRASYTPGSYTPGNTNSGHVSVSVTLKLQQNDKVKAKFTGYLNNLNDPKTTYFEGRLISKLESSQTRFYSKQALFEAGPK